MYLQDLQEDDEESIFNLNLSNRALERILIVGKDMMNALAIEEALNCLGVSSNARL